MINTAQNLKEYKQRLKKALKNQFIHNTLGTFATAYKEARGRVFEGMDLPWPESQDRSRQRRWACCT